MQPVPYDSIDASRFLAQSQSRIAFAPTNDRRDATRDNRGRQQNPSGWRLGGSRVNPSRHHNPYQSTTSQASGFPFGSRLNPQPAPLFYSTTDEFREENDEEEHEREIADFYALQRSRRQLGESGLKESSEADERNGSSIGDSGHSADSDRGFRRKGGIRSSWRGDLSRSHAKRPAVEDVAESNESFAGGASQLGISNPMVDVGLEDTLRRSEFDDDEPPDDLMENPPSVQMPRKDAYSGSEQGYESDEQGYDTGHERLLGRSPGVYPEGDSVPEIVPSHEGAAPQHDAFWGHLYLLALAGMFATWFLYWLQTDPGDARGDTVYNTLHGSFGLLSAYTVVSIFVALLWLAALRAYVRYLVYAVILVLPIILYSFSLYPFIASYTRVPEGGGTQNVLMRWGSFVPFVMATLWILAVLRSRLAMQKAISILEFATRILAANPALVIVGFATLSSIIGFTWMWLAMFTRVFLRGHPPDRGMVLRFVIDTSTWWVGTYFILVYLWTIAVIFGLQRTITSATVSQWYFHRLAVPAPTSQTIVQAALRHSATTLFGTIGLYTGLSLVVRLPLLILPRRLTMLLSLAMYSLIPSPIAVLINPLTLTYSAIHSQPLRVSARGLSQMHFLVPNDVSTSLHPNTFRKQGRDGWSNDNTPLLPYRLAKLILHSTRFMMSFALGFGGWVTTSRALKIQNEQGVRGSLYAYVVGLVAGAIGWGILGAMEGVLACIVDAVVVCWGSEVGSSGTGEARYCREAGFLFSEDADTGPGRVSLA
ncbi:uncharacterized protein HMPREF1541_08619 [Cyphellophora europaea CBS 101466]|uniref:Protein PNS1 n=1 Tax=Cyphellophora europaea (strain CBS 101466) TaxID=1220924 RepID=W2RIM0_CYPE1|nr:uncharacterized protein HMPREF1541_08619 [Cyphellophora europaea CBS 101466]ETN36342.1 hypothetical protein HMPREF1541_08619 [Cyphellophora europaea CBS 101466]